MAHKTFVIDTNVFLHDPTALFQFKENNILIPIAVLEELDKMKRLPGELGRNARETIRLLDSLKNIGEGNLHVGVKLTNGSLVRVQPELKVSHKYNFEMNINDNRIIGAAFLLHEQGEKVIFVSKDFAARVKAESMGMEAEDYENLKYAYNSFYTGLTEIELPKHDIDTFYKDGKLKIPHLKSKPNEYFVMTSPENTSAIGKYDIYTETMEPLLKVNNLWGIKPKNVEQKCAVDLLLRDDIKLVTLIGPAGTGKTLLALACGMRKVFDEGVYSKILVSRPIIPIGRDIGYLPGTKEEKLFTWMQPIYDNLEYLCSSTGGESEETLKWVMNSKKIETEAVTFIRGRSMPGIYFFVDEAQNLTPHEIKTIISRAGEGTKVIFSGDPNQIDNPYLDENSNGLTYAVHEFMDHKIFGHIYLPKTERSELASLAAKLAL